MSVVGVDLGNLNTVIAVARNRGVDVITNEVSNRATPSLVSFGPKSRYLGEAAQTQHISNFKNTVGSLKRLAGRRFADPEITEIESKYIGAELVDCEGQVGARVRYQDRDEIFTSTQLLAMLLTKVKLTTQAELQLPVSDIVISVPGWFSDAQRRSVLDASEIAGLNTLRLINDNTASALGYGITKFDLPEDTPRNVCFVDVGHSNYGVSIVAFKKGQLHVLSTAYNRHFGGRNFDDALIDHFAQHFKTKNNIDIKSNAKALIRLQAAVEKVKKILSANMTAPLNVESIMNDIDVSAMITREEFEQLVQPLLDQVTAPIEQALVDAKLDISAIDSIEMVGGSTRIPSLKERISKFFGKTLSFTLNADEAIARGAAFACAILSPAFRVRDFAIHDISPYPIAFEWERIPEIPDEDAQLTVFTRGNPVPSTKVLTFYRKEPFSIEVSYLPSFDYLKDMNSFIGHFQIKNVQPSPDGELSIVKVRARVNIHGVVNLEGAYVVAEEEVEETIKIEEPLSAKDTKEESNKDKMDVDNKDAQTGDAQAMPPQPQKQTRKVKKLIKKADLPVVGGTNSLSPSIKVDHTETEAKMTVEDKLVADTEDRRNALEEYIYDMRAKLDDLYSSYANEEEKTQFRDVLEQAENWLYDEGEDTTKTAYIAKMDELEKFGAPIRQRYLNEIEAAKEAARKEQAEKEAREAAAAAAAATAAAATAADSAAQLPNGTKSADEEMVEEPANTNSK